MKIGPLLLFLAFLVVPPLLSALGRWLQQQLAEAGAGGRPAEPPPDAGRERARSAKPRPRAPVPPAAAPAAVPTPTRPVDAPTGSAGPVLAARRSMLAGLGSPREQRHSMVVAAVLGPCRALDPY